MLQCLKCGKMGYPYQMLANLDGRPFVDYEHERCPPIQEGVNTWD